MVEMMTEMQMKLFLVIQTLIRILPPAFNVTNPSGVNNAEQIKTAVENSAAPTLNKIYVKIPEQKLNIMHLHLQSRYFKTYSQYTSLSSYSSSEKWNCRFLQNWTWKLIFKQKYDTPTTTLISKANVLSVNQLVAQLFSSNF